MTGLLRALKPLGSALMAVAVVIVLWLGFIKLTNLNAFVAKSPIDVIRFFANGGANGEKASDVYSALGQTCIDAGVGLVVGLAVALVVSVAFVLSRTVEASFMPLALVIRSVPVVAMTPVITLVFGRNLTGVVVITAIVVFFPALVTITFGLRSTSRQAVELCRACGAGGATILRKVMLPSALPALFAAARVAVPGSLVGALLAEFLASGKGVGYEIALDEHVSSYDSVWAAVAAVTLLSVVVYYLVQALENVVLNRFGPAGRPA